MSSEKLWNMFCRRMNMADISVPLFDVDEKLNVRIHEIGITRRRFVLRRNHQMEKMIIEETNKLVLVDVSVTRRVRSNSDAPSLPSSLPTQTLPISVFPVLR